MIKKTEKEILEDLNGLKKNGFEVVGEYRRDNNIIYLKRPNDPVAIPFHLKDSGFNEGLNDLLNSENKRLENLEEFMKEIKKIIRDSGRTSVVSISEIEQLIVRYDKK